MSPEKQVLDQQERLEAVEAIRVGIAAAEGRTRPARRALADLQETLGLHIKSDVPENEEA
jgi:hypothetical protein